MATEAFRISSFFKGIYTHIYPFCGFENISVHIIAEMATCSTECAWWITFMNIKLSKQKTKINCLDSVCLCSVYTNRCRHHCKRLTNLWVPISKPTTKHPPPSAHIEMLKFILWIRLFCHHFHEIIIFYFFFFISSKCHLLHWLHVENVEGGIYHLLVVEKLSLVSFDFALFSPKELKWFHFSYSCFRSLCLSSSMRLCWFSQLLR